MGKNSDLSPECQKFVKKLFAFFSKEKATKKPIVSFDGFGCVLHFSAPYYEW